MTKEIRIHPDPAIKNRHCDAETSVEAIPTFYTEIATHPSGARNDTLFRHSGLDPESSIIMLRCEKSLDSGFRRKDDQQSLSANLGMHYRANGFTLIEIIVVVFILSLLAAIVAPRLIGRTEEARVTEAKVQIKNFETALKLFNIDNGFYPSTEQGLEALTEKPQTGRIPEKYREGGYLEQKNIPKDPWGAPYIYVSPGINGDFDILSLGADKEEGGEGNNADIKSWETN